MIRYVLAVLLAVTLLGLTATALDHASAVRAEQSIESEIEKIDESAASLLEAETPAPSTEGPQRTVEIEIPAGTYTVAGTERLVFEPVPDAGATRVRYSVGDRAEKRTTLDLLLRHPETGAIDLSDHRGTQRLKLTLRADENGDPFVEVTFLKESHI